MYLTTEIIEIKVDVLDAIEHAALPILKYLVIIAWEMGSMYGQ